MKYKTGINEILSGKPIQYVIGTTNFYGYDFIVNKEVLLPRPETEGLVQYCISYINDNFQNAKIIDLGCGSGAIGITIKKEIKNVEVTCLDISSTALDVAKSNAQSLNANVEFCLGDMLQNNSIKYDMIVSNPPYIAITEEVEKIVYDNEPHAALFAKNDGLYFYEEIIKSSVNNTKEKSIIAFEIGATQASSIIKYSMQYYPSSKYIVKNDLTGKERYLFILNNIE